MEQFMWYALEGFIIIMDTIIFMTFFHWVSNAWKVKKIGYALFAIIYSGMQVFAGELDYNPFVKTCALIALGFLCARWLYGMKGSEGILAALYYCVAITLSEGTMMGAIMSLYGYGDISVFVEEDVVRIQEIALSRVMAIMILYIGIHFFQLHKRKNRLRELALVFLQTISYLLVLMMGLEFTREYGLRIMKPYAFTILSLVCLATFFVGIRLTEYYFRGQEKDKELIRYEELIKRKEQYEEIKRETEENIRRLYHDLKGHLLVLEKMQEGSDNNSMEYLEKMKEPVHAYEMLSESGCDVVDMVLYERQKAFEKEGIMLHISIENRVFEGLDAFHLCSILNNAFDNAFEAITEEKLEKGEVWIKACKKNGKVHVQIENRYGGNLKRGMDGKLLTQKKDVELHGIGLKSIEEAVKRMGGNMSISTENGIFSLFILI